MRRILCLHLPNWPIQRVLAGPDVGQVSNLPYILHARDPRRGQIVVAVSDAAKNRGVRPGMPLAEAATLDVSILPHDPAADLAELARLAEHCERFSPLVGWQTVEGDAESKVQSPKSKVPPELGPWTLDVGLFLDVTGIGVLFGGEERLAAEVVAHAARLGYTVRVAIAETIGAAWAWARRDGEAPTQRGPQVGDRRSEVGADNSESVSVLSTQYLVLSTNTPLDALPLATLRLPADTLDLFTQLGLKCIAHLLALPRASLRARFGEQVLLRLDQLTGAAQETIVAHRLPPKFAAEWVLEYPAERRDIIGQIVYQLVSRVAAVLAERREGVVRLHCRLDCGAGKRDACPTKIEVGLFRPSADARHLWDLVRMQLEQMRLPGPVGRVTLQAVETAPLENRQAELFAGGQDEADRQLALLIDRLASRLGPEAVFHPQLTSDPLPERASQRSEVKGRRSGVRRARGNRGARNSELGTKARRRYLPEPSSRSALRVPSFALLRPLFLRPPLPLDTVSVVPDGPPINFRYQGRLHHVVHHWGPERIETGWFRGASVRRDYYRALTDEGLRFWLFRQLNDGRWHLHGEFS